MASLARRPTVLIVLHQEHSTPGRVGMVLKALGVRLDIRRPSLGDPLPETLHDHQGAIVFGGPMSANDEQDWLNREIAWLEAPLRENTPFLGICLGAQMLSKCLGSRVYTFEDRRSEIGYYPIIPSGAGERLCEARFPRCVYQWHCDGFDLPRGAELLASGGADFPNQAYRYGARAVALQFHPEVTYHMMSRWTVRGAERLSRPGAQNRPNQLGGWFQHDGAVAVWLAAFLPRWLDGELSPACESRGEARPESRRPGFTPAETLRRESAWPLAAASPDVSGL